jgi:hypothetical protein
VIGMIVRERLTVGRPIVIAAQSVSDSLGTLFEDDGVTGYFYAVRLPDHEILDAVHIYNAASVVDRDREWEVEIIWSSDGLKSALLINQYAHAVFDFSAKRGYCRTDFPNSLRTEDDGWHTEFHLWDDTVMKSFRP